VSDLLREAATRLSAAGVSNPRLDARLLWEHARFSPLRRFAPPPPQAGEERTRQILSSPVHGGGGSRSEPEGGSVEQFFESLIARRAAREPLAYIVGRKEFWSLDFDVGPGVLIPRPETETIIEQACAHFTDRSAELTVLDFGTGTGCLLVAFLKEFIRAVGLGIENSGPARGYALRNVVRHDLAARGKIRAGDWDDGLTGRFDAILSNPPYIRTGELAGLEPELHHEPQDALDGGPDGLAAYRLLAPAIALHLKPGGRAFLEIGAGQADAVCALLADAGVGDIRICPDLAGIPRVLSAGCGDLDEKTVGKGHATR
jgi:release factor glutamine methyltransferase